MKDVETSLLYCNSSLWSCDSSWRNSIMSCACWRCTWISERVVLLMFTMSPVDEKIKLLRIWDSWMCVAMLACSLWIQDRLYCCLLLMLEHVLKFYILVVWTLDFTLTWWQLICLNASLTLCECFNQLHTGSFVVDVVLWTFALDFDMLACLVVWMTRSLVLIGWMTLCDFLNVLTKCADFKKGRVSNSIENAPKRQMTSSILMTQLKTYLT